MNNILTQFVNDVKSSLYKPSFFSSLRERPFGSSIKYFLGLSALLAFIVAFVLGSRSSTLFRSETLKRFISYYPEELTLTVKDGVVSTNVEEPYIIPSGAVLSEETKKSNVVVIDTKNDFSRERFSAYDASVWIGKDFLVSVKKSNQTELVDTKEVPNMIVNRETLSGWAERVASHKTALSFGLFAILFFVFYGFFITKLLWLLVMTLIVLAYAKIRQYALSYKQLYQIGLHAITVPLILSGVFLVSSFREPIPFFFTVLFLLITLSNLRKVGASFEV